MRPPSRVQQFILTPVMVRQTTVLDAKRSPRKWRAGSTPSALFPTKEREKYGSKVPTDLAGARAPWKSASAIQLGHCDFPQSRNLLVVLTHRGARRVIYLQYLYQQISASTKLFHSVPAYRTILSLTILHGPFQQGLKALYLLGFPVAKYD